LRGEEDEEERERKRGEEKEEGREWGGGEKERGKGLSGD
jgi:hypothetical protein